MRPRLRGAPGAPAGLRLGRRHLPGRVRTARRALPRAPGPARHVPGALPEVLRAGGLPAAAVVRGGPDGQRALRAVPRRALPRAVGPRPGPVRQQQRHLHLLLPPAPGHLLPGPLHRRAPRGQLRRCAGAAAPGRVGGGGGELPVSRPGLFIATAAESNLCPSGAP